MNLNHIQAFYFTVNCNSISKAAKKLHLTQPGLSMQLQILENEIGSKLLNRSNKGVQLTDEGKLVYDFAETMLSLQENLNEKLNDMKNKKTNFVVGCCKSFGEQILPCSIYTFKEIYSKSNITMDVDNSASVLKKLLNHEISIGFIENNLIPNDSFELVPILSTELVLVTGIKDVKKLISLNELCELPLILREDGSFSRQNLENSLKSHNLTFTNCNIVLSLNSPQAIKSSLISGRGYSFVPQISIAHEIRNGLLNVVNVDTLNIPITYYIAFRKNYIFSKYEQKFVDFLTSKKRCFCF